MEFLAFATLQMHFHQLCSAISCIRDFGFLFFSAFFHMLCLSLKKRTIPRDAYSLLRLYFLHMILSCCLLKRRRTFLKRSFSLCDCLSRVRCGPSVSSFLFLFISIAFARICQPGQMLTDCCSIGVPDHCLQRLLNGGCWLPYFWILFELLSLFFSLFGASVSTPISKGQNAAHANSWFLVLSPYSVPVPCPSFVFGLRFFFAYV